MRSIPLLPLAAAWFLAGCSSPPEAAPPAPRKNAEPVRAAPRPAEPAKITQFYASVPAIQAGGKTLVCYGVENARAVWLSPPKQELSAAISRCVEAAPAATTAYTLTVEGRDGRTVTRGLTVTVEALPPPAGPRARIVDVTVSALSVRAGQPVSICYNVENAVDVSIEPIRFKGGPKPGTCAVDQPRQTVTYVITARGEGSQDTERVTVKVQ